MRFTSRMTPSLRQLEVAAAAGAGIAGTETSALVVAATAGAAAATSTAPRGILRVAAGHWAEYLMEALGLAVFMFSACAFGVLLQFPGSPIYGIVSHEVARRALFGLVMGLTSIAIVYSPLGQQSGAHLNPSVTLTFLRLKKIQVVDAAFYVISQFIGGVLGVIAAVVVVGKHVADPAVHYVVTIPGPHGVAPALLAEFVIAFILMSAILRTSNNPRLHRWTGVIAGALVAGYIAIEAPISGMSMNPARTVASAVPAHLWTGAWIYFTAPPLGMLAAAELYLMGRGEQNVFCAKLNHENHTRCIFNCRFAELNRRNSNSLS
jgi:aquaporin Z